MASSRGTRRRSAAVTTGIALSRLTGLARERALGYFLGTTFAADAFTAASRIPGMFQRLAGEGVLSASFIPSYTRLLAEGREKDAGRMAGAVLGLLTVAIATIVLLGVVFAEPLTWVVAAGFRDRPQTFDLTVKLVRLLFPAVGFSVLSAWCLGILNSHRRFFLPYVAPAIVNLAQIGVLVAAGVTALTDASPGSGAISDSTRASLGVWLAAGTIVGGALQFLVQLPSVIRLNRDTRVSVRTNLPGVRTTIKAFGPMVTARGLGQLLMVVQLFMATFLAAGGLATLRYAQMLYQLPSALFGRAIAAAELPEFARTGAGDPAELVKRLQDGLAGVAAFVVPTTIGFLVIGDLITAAVFQTGGFTTVDTFAVWIVLIGFTFGLLPRASSRLLQSVMYGIGNTRTPARIAMVRMAISVIVSFILMWQFDRVQVSDAGVEIIGQLPAFGPLPAPTRNVTNAPHVVTLGAAGLSSAAAVACWVEYLLLRRAVGQRIGRSTIGGGQLPRISLAGLVAGASAFATRYAVAGLSPIPAGALAVIAMAGVYAAVAVALGVPDIRDAVTALISRLRAFLTRRRTP